MSVPTKLSLSFATFLGVGWLLTPACGSSPGSAGGAGSSSGGTGSSSGTTSSSSGATGDGSASSGAYCGAPGVACCAAPGQVPNPECDDGDETQCATSTTCSIAPSCGSTATCEPLADNTGKTTQDFRMRRIILVSPPKLATVTVQTAVVTDGVDMLETQCGEEGSGLFNWILSFDMTTRTVTTGGAPQCDTTGRPPCDPFTTGYCFVHKNVDGIHVAPVTAPITQAADGTWGTARGDIPLLNIPIYFGGTSASAPTIILLPISDAAVTGAKISTDGNCIGSLNPGALAPDCSDNYQNCSKWRTDASLSGYITLRAANAVQISLLSETLCTLLSGDSTGTPTAGTSYKTCATDANGNPTVAQGDYCSTSNQAGDCKDSFWLSAVFAASAVNLNDGTGVPDCTADLGDGGATDAAASD